MQELGLRYWFLSNNFISQNNIPNTIFEQIYNSKSEQAYLEL